MRVACLYHDAEKHGKNGSKHTIFEHPVCAAETVRGYRGQYLSEEEIDYVADAIISHMGVWNTSKRSNVVLPIPETSSQMLVHLCDYLSSKKDIEIQFENYTKPELPPLEDFVLDFGRHKGKLLVEVAKTDTSYISWLKTDYGKEPVRSLVQKL